MKGGDGHCFLDTTLFKYVLVRPFNIMMFFEHIENCYFLKLLEYGITLLYGANVHERRELEP